MSENVVHLGAHERMTPEEALAVAKTYPWGDVIVCGFTSNAEGIVMLSSHMPRETALWIAEHLKKHVLGELE